MGADAIFLVMLGFLLLSLFVGNWVFVALGLTGVIGLFLMNPAQLNMVPTMVWGTLNSPTLSAAPLFVFMGEIILRSGLSAQTYQGLSRLVGFLPGGLLHTNVVGCAAFAAISGSSVATAATIGTVAVPDQKARGYDESLLLGSIAASGTLGILIPPSINMIIYGAWVETSIGRLFAGGVVPGIIMALLFSLYIAIRVSVTRSLAPRLNVTWSDVLPSFKYLAPIGILMVFIFYAIFSGVMTPTETAGVGAAAALLIAAVMRRFSWRLVYESAISALGVSCMILLIIGGASVAAYAMTISGVPVRMVEWVAASGFSALQVLLILYVLYLALGCVMDGISMMLVTLPFVLPILLAMQIDLVWFGVVLIILTEMGMLTPPLGVNLYVVLGIDRSAGFEQVVKAVLPFLVLQGLVVVLVTAYPEVVLFLPDLLFGRP